MSSSNKIIEKIQKLLSLANSSNENEAKSATNMANTLLLKHNLSLQQIEDHQSEYETLGILETGLTLRPYQKLIAQLLQEFFFVRITISKKYIGQSSGKWAQRTTRSQYKKTIQLLGTKENCQIASYIFSYLNQTYPKLWQDYFDRDASVNQSDKISYYTGLTAGISKMLTDTKWKVEEETGLVLKSDPKLEEYVKKNSTGSYGSNRESDINHEVYKDGVQDGTKITLRKPIESTSTNQGLYLDNKKR